MAHTDDLFLLERTNVGIFLKRIHETLVIGCMYAHCRPSFTLSCYEVKKWWLQNVKDEGLSFKLKNAPKYFDDMGIFKMVVAILDAHFKDLGFDECVKSKLFVFDNGLKPSDDDDNDDIGNESKRLACRWVANQDYARRFASQKMYS